MSSAPEWLAEPAGCAFVACPAFKGVHHWTAFDLEAYRVRTLAEGIAPRSMFSRRRGSSFAPRRYLGIRHVRTRRLASNSATLQAAIRAFAFEQPLGCHLQRQMRKCIEDACLQLHRWTLKRQPLPTTPARQGSGPPRRGWSPLLAGCEIPKAVCPRAASPVTLTSGGPSDADVWPDHARVSAPRDGFAWQRQFLLPPCQLLPARCYAVISYKPSRWNCSSHSGSFSAFNSAAVRWMNYCTSNASRDSRSSASPLVRALNGADAP